jgi:hypothetical protein
VAWDHWQVAERRLPSSGVPVRVRRAGSVLVLLLAASVLVDASDAHSVSRRRTERDGAPVEVLGVQLTRTPSSADRGFSPADATSTSTTAVSPAASVPSSTAPTTSTTVETATVPASSAEGPLSAGPSVAEQDPQSGPVTNVVALDANRRFVNQSTSFTSKAGQLSSRRPQAGEPATTSLFAPPSQGLPAGVEWRVLWLRARNCEDGSRPMEFFVQDEARGTVRRFVQNDAWMVGQPARSVAVSVAPGGELAWTDTTAAPLVVGPGQSIGAKWNAMTGGAANCNWQFAAIEQPAGTGAHAGDASAWGLADAGGSFADDRLGLRASWRTVPGGSFWIPQSVQASNCDAAPRGMEVILLGPGGITMGVLSSAPDGAAPELVPPGGTLRWSAAERGNPLVVLPPGWSLGVRWLGMAGGRPGATCQWAARVSVAPSGTTVG